MPRQRRHKPIVLTDDERRTLEQWARKANIVGFFESLAPLTITRFEPHTIFDGDDKVFVLIAFEATARGKDDSFPNNGHRWQFNAAGKVVKYNSSANDAVTTTLILLPIRRRLT